MIRIFVTTLVVLVSLHELRADDRSTSSVGAGMTAAAQGFLASLDDEQSTKAVLAFDNPARQDWHNIPKDKRKGLQFRDMSPAQKENCRALLGAALSESGYDKALKIMSLENNLREGEKNVSGAPLRDPDRYFLTIFGKPDHMGTWGWCFEGHHLSLNFVIRDSEVICNTPSFWVREPSNRVHPRRRRTGDGYSRARRRGTNCL